MQKRSGKRTLLMSVLMSAPGPLVVGLGLITGRSSTQLADFFRRSAELLAIICSYIVYGTTSKDGNTSSQKRAELERKSNLFVGAVMCISGAVMIFISVFGGSEEKGNVIPGLVIALLGVIANTLFFIKYTKLNRDTPNAIIAVQARLYRAKSLVDACVTTALLAVALFPISKAALMLDAIGSVIVAVYLIYCGIKTIKESTQKEVMK
ncbi:MAG: cation transporter [Clostridia bacterium]|nr:cation transporter [Clostridia bacterium]